jgi:hypothetical protein
MTSRLRTFLALVLLIAFVSFPCAVRAELPGTTQEAPFTFLPPGLLFQPLSANHQEPRMGLRKQVGSSKMRLDIGNSVDLAEYAPAAGRAFRFGVDFFAYALTTNSQGLRLQVDALDGFIGGHLSFAAATEHSRLAARLRLMHLSAHFVDGHFDNSSGKWKGGRDPIPFTKDFGECTGSFSWETAGTAVMVYSGFSYTTLVRPTEIQRIATLHGLEIRTQNLLGPTLEKPTNLYLADHFTLVGVPKYAGTNNLEFGIKFGEWSSTGIRLYGSYFSGLDMFSEYYNVRTNHWGIGFAFDFW